MNEWNNTKITPFIFYCQHILPIVYDESLSYYEVLCKIQVKLNEVIKTQNDLQNAFQNLLNWVNTQLEEYAKQQLVEWKNDGTLESIINEQIFGKLNQKVTDLQTDVNFLMKRIIHMKDYVIPDGNTDNTVLMQQAINEAEGHILYIDGNAFPYRCNQLLLKSNSIYYCEESTIIKANDTWVNSKHWQDPLIDIRLVSNVKWYGNGATITMNKPTKLLTEHAHCMGTRGAKNVYIENMYLSNASGDGFYIDQYDGDETNTPSSFIELKNTICDSNARNGLSLVSGHDILIDNCVLKNTSGTPPHSGLDIEPELRSNDMQNITIRNCSFIANRQQGIMISISKLQATLGVVVENCYMYDNRTNIYVQNTKQGQKGYIIFNNCYMENGHGSNLLDLNNHYKGILREYNNMYALNGNTDNAKQNDDTMGLVGWASNYQVCAHETNSGNAIFNNCISVDNRNTPQIKTSFGLTQYGTYQINNVRLIGCTSNGCDTTVLGNTNRIYNLLVDDTLDRNVIDAYGTTDKFIDARNSHCLIKDGVVFVNSNNNRYAEIIMVNTKGKQANLKAGSGVNIMGKTNISLPNLGSYVHIYTFSGFTWFVKSAYDIAIS